MTGDRGKGRVESLRPPPKKGIGSKTASAAANEQTDDNGTPPVRLNLSRTPKPQSNRGSRPMIVVRKRRTDGISTGHR
jgi:hypothetical protein